MAQTSTPAPYGTGASRRVRITIGALDYLGRGSRCGKTGRLVLLGKSWGQKAVVPAAKGCGVEGHSRTGAEYAEVTGELAAGRVKVSP